MNLAVAGLLLFPVTKKLKDELQQEREKREKLEKQMEDFEDMKKTLAKILEMRHG